MTTRVIDESMLVEAAVPPDAPLARAAQELTEAATGAVAVVARDGRVVGTFTNDDLLAAIFPGYLEDLHHTAFVDDDVLAPHLAGASAARVADHMSRVETVELPASALDVAQRFLHTDASGLVATREGKFVGVIDERRFCTAILRRYGWSI